MNFEQLNSDRFKKRVQDHFSTAYLTLISIIQGVAFGFCAQMVWSQYFTANQKVCWSYLIYPGFSMLGIMIVFFSYNWFVSIVFSPPNLRETVIPFLLGISEVLPMYFFNEPEKWWLFFAIFCTVGGIAYLNTLRSLWRHIYTDRFADAFDIIRTELYWNAIYCFLAAFICLLAHKNYIGQKDMKVGISLQDIEYSIYLTIIMAFLLIKSQFWFLPKLYDLAGLQMKNTEPENSEKQNN